MTKPSYCLFNRYLTCVNRCCGKTPKGVYRPEHVGIWNDLVRCVEVNLHTLHEDATRDYGMWVIRESQCQPSGFTYEEMEKVEKQELVYWLLYDVKKNVRVLRSFKAMITAMELCQNSGDECMQQYYINQAVTSIVKELVALIDIFYKCQFSVAELRKMPTATFTQYQKHLNVFSEWFKRRCVL